MSEKPQEKTTVPKVKNIQVNVTVQPEHAHLIRNLANGLRDGRLSPNQVIKLT